MKKIGYSTLLILGLTVNLVFGQKATLKQNTANEPVSNSIRTSAILFELAKNGYQSPEILEKVANSFYFNRKMKEACKWYNELLSTSKNVEPTIFFRYSQALRSVGKYDDSQKWMNLYLDTTHQNWSMQDSVSGTDLISGINQAETGNIKIFNLNINTAVSDFGSELVGDSLIFSSSREEGEIYPWNGQPYLDLYIATAKDDSTYVAVKPLEGKINTRYHESSAAFTDGGETLFFTRNNFYRNRYRTAKDRVNKLKIFKASWNHSKNRWDNIEPLVFCSDEYSVAHPCFNQQGTKMYFASDMPGSLGHSDIYVADVLPDGSFGTPINLGPDINTEGQETFPFMNSNGDLFFASNGLPGLGGLDIFVIRNFESFAPATDQLPIYNPGSPINSTEDDFGYHEASSPTTGFFTSNRAGGKGDDDIYVFRFYPCMKTITGIVKDNKVGEIIPSAVVRAYNQSGDQLLDSVSADASGRFSFELPCHSGYILRAVHPDYIGDEALITVPTEGFVNDVDLRLTRDVHAIDIEMDLAKILDISMIYFDLNKHYIRSDASIELHKIAKVMEQFPQMEIDIRSHTDCRGSAAYNLKLSEARARSTRQYLIDHGIEMRRMTATGLGESEPVNQCDCDEKQQQPCSEEEHQLNRRSEFIIKKLD